MCVRVSVCMIRHARQCLSACKAMQEHPDGCEPRVTQLILEGRATAMEDTWPCEARVYKEGVPYRHGNEQTYDAFILK